jgi:hypothetical protein
MAGPKPSDLGWLATLTGSDGISLVGRAFAEGQPDPASSHLRVYAEIAALRAEAAGELSMVVTDEEETFRELLGAGMAGGSIYVGESRLQELDGVTPFSYVNNPDGTVRWLFPAHGRDASYLELYNPNSLKGRLSKAFARALARVGFGDRLTSGSFYADFSGADLVARWLGGEGGFETIAIFSGTRGFDRTVVAALGRGGRVTHFLKIPLTTDSRAMLQTEFCVLDRIGGDLGPGVVVPSVSAGREGAVLLENIRPPRARSGQNLTERHVAFLRALYVCFARTTSLQETASYHEVAARISRLPTLDLPGRDGLAEKGRIIIDLAVQLLAPLPTAESVSVSLAHGDFTPWNLYEGKRCLHVYDWELAREAPLLSDLFHFVCQTGVLVRKEPPDRTIQRLQKEFAKPEIGALVQRYDIRPDLHLRLYLLEKATYYLERYARQTALHRQAHWLLDFWTHALRRCAREPRLL